MYSILCVEVVEGVDDTDSGLQTSDADSKFTPIGLDKFMYSILGVWVVVVVGWVDTDSELDEHEHIAYGIFQTGPISLQ